MIASLTFKACGMTGVNILNCFSLTGLLAGSRRRRLLVGQGFVLA